MERKESILYSGFGSKKLIKKTNTQKVITIINVIYLGSIHTWRCINWIWEIIANNVAAFVYLDGLDCNTIRWIFITNVIVGQSFYINCITTKNCAISIKNTIGKKTTALIKNGYLFTNWVTYISNLYTLDCRIWQDRELWYCLNK